MICCRFEADCGDCGEDGTGWCHQSADNCVVCTGVFDPSGSAPSCGGSPSPPGPSPPAPVGTPVERHGALRVEGLKIVDKNGAPVQLTGMSMFWSQWSGQYWNADVVNWLAQDFQLNFIRAAMGVDSGGYEADPAGEKAKLVAVVNACIDAGIYVMIDWHDHSAYDHVDAAIGFFDEMARTYGHLPNVLFETFNEPLQGDDWNSVLKPYHDRLVPVIRQHSQNIITMGTRSWSQEVDEACRNRVQGTNLMYTLHFYAQIHKGELRAKGDAAMNMGCPIFISEWGTGFDFLDLGSASEWLSWADYHQLSNANWGVYDKAGEKNALLEAGASGSGGWPLSQLTESGRWVRDYFYNGMGGGGGSPGGGCCKFGADCGDCGDC